ncbi:MAG: aldehyde-activating protein [Gammaproteobacteria bacterium]|nr:aldehyde-activating protein [Gammaproteobacteria bacterium]
MNLRCHCNNITIEAPLPEQVTICNCSICSRYQSLWGYYRPEEVKIDIGTKGASSYIWGDRVIEFVSCSSCSCITHYRSLPGQSEPRVALNFRMSSEDAIADVPIRYFDGKSIL